MDNLEDVLIMLGIILLVTLTAGFMIVMSLKRYFDEYTKRETIRRGLLERKIDLEVEIMRAEYDKLRTDVISRSKEMKDIRSVITHLDKEVKKSLYDNQIELIKYRKLVHDS